jgi:16S rRNA processing protein RimM
MAGGKHIPLARVVKPHGLDGEVAVMLEEHTRELPLDVPVSVVPPTTDVSETRITSVRQGPKGPLARLAGVDHIAQAETLRGRMIAADPATLSPGTLLTKQPSADGARVEDIAHGYLGTVIETIITGANDVWVVDGGPHGQVLIPVIDEVVIAVDDGTITVRLLPGLLEGDA